MRWRWRDLALAAVVLGGFSCDAKSPAAPSSPALLTAVVGSCTYQIDPSGLPATIPASGGTYSVQLTTTVGCVWSVEVPFLPFFGFVESSTASGSGSRTIGLTVHPHTGTHDRKVDITIATIKMSRIQSGAPMPVAGPNAILVYSGTADEPMTYGQAGVATTDQFKVTSLEFGALPVFLKIDALGPTPTWPRQFSITIQAANRTPLSPGVYNDLSRWLGLNGATNTAQVYVSSFGCDVATSSNFEILDIARNPDGSLSRTHFTMLYRCASDPNSFVTLEVWYPSKGAY